MQIQWFPGHMNKARKQIEQSRGQVDVFIELLDARIPYSSENPMLESLRGDKPCLKILSKSDLADAELTKVWQKHLEKQRGVRSRAVTTLEPPSIMKIPEICLNMLPHKKESGKPITTMIVGIPNVGKSTLINMLAGRSIAKTGNEPAVTKGQQRVNIGNGITLLDTPGVLWPNVENPNSGYRLAVTGAIKDTATDYADVAFFAAEYLLSNYSAALVERFSLESVPCDQTELLELIGRKRGCLRKGGVVDLDRVSRIFLAEFRSGKLGPITLETPEMMEKEKSELQERIAEKAATQAESQKRKGEFERDSKPSRKRKRKRNQD